MEKRSLVAFTGRVERAWRLIDRLDETERRRLRGHGAALLIVAGAVVLKWLFGATDQASSFALLTLAVAGAAVAGGLPSALLATMAAVLSARLVSDASWGAAAVFSVEAVLVAGLVAFVRSR